MAQIPMGGFGNVVSAPVRSQRISTQVEDNSAEFINQGLQKIGGAIQAKFNIDKEIKETQAATDVMRYGTQLKQVRSDLEKQYDEGALSWDAMDSAYQQAKAKVPKPATAGLDPVFSERMGLQLQQTDMESDDNWGNVSGRARKGAMQTATISAVDEMYKANIDNPAMVEKYLASPEFEQKGFVAFGEEWPLKKTAMIEGAYQNSITERIIAAGDDVGSLESIRASLDSDEMKMRLDPQRRLSLLNGVSSTIDREREQAQRRAEAAQEKAESYAARSVDKWSTHIQEGRTIPVSEVGALIEQTKGTSLEGAAHALVASQAEIQKVLDAPAEQRTAFMLDLRSQMNQEGSTPDQEDRYKRLESAIKNRQQMEKDDPHTVYEMKTGEQKISVDWSADTLQVALAERQARAKASGVDTLLKPAEKKNFVESFEKLDPVQKMEQLRNLQSRLEPDTFQQVIAEIGDKKETAMLSFTGILAGQGKDADAMLVLKGDEIEKGGATGYISKTEFSKNLGSNFYSAFTGNEGVREATIDIAYKRYLASATAGKEMEPSEIESAVKAVVGDTPIIGRRATIMPTGMDADKFQDAIKESFYAVQDRNDLGGDWDDYEYTPIIDKATGSIVYRLDADGLPVGSQPIYLDVQ